MQENGFIKIHRKIKSWRWYQDIPVKTLFLHLILSANLEERGWMEEIVKRGQLVTKVEALAYETGLTSKQVRTALEKLERTGEISKEGKRSKYTVITINGFERYQSEGDSRDGFEEHPGIEAEMIDKKGEGGAKVNPEENGVLEPVLNTKKADKGIKRAKEGQNEGKTNNEFWAKPKHPENSVGMPFLEDEKDGEGNRKAKENQRTGQNNGDMEDIPVQIEFPERERKKEAKKEREYLINKEVVIKERNRKERKEEMFEVFWKAYPRKVAKSNAKKAFVKLNVDEQLFVLMLSSLESQKKSRQWQDVQYIPHPTTWLNQKRWESEEDFVRTSPQKNYDEVLW